MESVSVPPVIDVALNSGAMLAVSISGGKDSQAMARQLQNLCTGRGHTAVFAIHMDLGRAEWKQTPGVVEDIAAENGFELITVRRPQGDLVHEIQDRMEKLRGTGKPFWPSASSRYCTADQKRSQADRVYRQYELIISAEGSRAQESTKRRGDPVVGIRKQITAKPFHDMDVDNALAVWLDVKALLEANNHDAIRKRYSSFVYYISNPASMRLALTWYPIHDWSVDDVWVGCGTSTRDLRRRRILYKDGHENEALDGWPCHPAYVWGNERLSCAICILASAGDIRNGAKHNPDLAQLYLQMEEVGGSTFKNGVSLADILSGDDNDIQLSLF